MTEDAENIVHRTRVRITDTITASERTNAMWDALGDAIESQVQEFVAAGNPQEAIRWATCAEACFWKATGEADTHDVKDVLVSPDRER